jgi:succinyl-CoA synthetase alpha subunit
MGIMVNPATQVVCFDAPGHPCRPGVELMRRAGTEPVALVGPAEAATAPSDVPRFATAKEAVRATGANAAFVSTGEQAAADAMMEAVDAGLALVVCRTPSVPARDLVKVIGYLETSAGLEGPRYNAGRVRLLGPGSRGAITPGAGMVGTLDPDAFRPGPVGLVSRCGALAEAAAARLTGRGIGQSTCLVTSFGLISPTRLADVLGMFEADPDTEVIALIGGAGGDAEYEAATFIQEAVTKPIVAYLAGRHAPPGVNVGAAGDFVSARPGEVADKTAALRRAGVTVVDALDDLPAAAAERL